MIALGSNEIASAYVGGNAVVAMYLGSTLVFGEGSPSPLYGLSDDGEGGFGELTTEPDWGFAIGDKWGFLDDGDGGISETMSTEPDYGFVFIDGVLQEELSTEYTHLLNHDMSGFIAVGDEEIIITDEWTLLLSDDLSELVEV